MDKLFRHTFVLVYLMLVAAGVTLVVGSLGLANDGTSITLLLLSMGVNIANLIWLLFYVNHIGKKHEKTLE